MNCYDKCVNKGRVYGLSQESYCEHCLRANSWKKDLYDEGPSADIPSEQNQCDGCKQGLRVIAGLHRTEDDKAFMVCTAYLYR